MERHSATGRYHALVTKTEEGLELHEVMGDDGTKGDLLLHADLITEAGEKAHNDS